MMTLYNDSDEEKRIESMTVSVADINFPEDIRSKPCPSCGHTFKIKDLGLPVGLKFNPNDQELLEYLLEKMSGSCSFHPPIDEFIPTIEGENVIWSTHPEKLLGMGKDGLIGHFFHRASKEYTTRKGERRKVRTDEGRERRKVDTDEEGRETRWHKTGQTTAIFSADGTVKGFKKILVLYAYYGGKKKPEKTNWVMHQYHLGSTKNEKDGDLVVSKIFYQRQPRQCGSPRIVNSFNNEANGNTNFSHSKITFRSCCCSSTSVCETDDSC